MSDSNPRNILRPLPTAEARRERYSQTGRITEADIREYMGEIRQMQSKYMSGDDLEAYMQNLEKKTRAQYSKELAASAPKPKKKKVRAKKKIESTDSIMVADKDDNISKVSSQDQGGQTGTSSLGGFKDLAKSIGTGTLALGSMAFNKMFPTLGAIMGAIHRRLNKNQQDTAENNAATRGYAQQVGRSSVLLSNIVEAQSRTNELLQQILNVSSGGAGLVPSSSPTIIPMPGGNRPAPAGNTPPPAASGGSGRTPPAASPAAPAPSATGPRAGLGRTLAAAGMGAAVGGGLVATSAMAATNPTAPAPTASGGGTPPRTPAPAAGSAATPERAETAIPSLPVPPAVTRQATRTATTPITEQEQADLFSNRILNIKAKEIIFKADRYEFDQSNAPTGGGGTAAGAPPPVVSSGGGGGGGAAAGGAAAAGAIPSNIDSSIQNVVQRISQDYPNAFVTPRGGLRPEDRGSQHSVGTAADLSLRGLTQEQRATLVQNIVSGRYGNIGGIGTYNTTGDLLHVDTRSGARMAWGPNYSRTSLNQTPQWFQAAVMPWMGGAAGGQAAAGAQQEPSQPTAAAAPAPSAPSTGAQVAQASVRSEMAVMQSQQVSPTLGETPEQPANPTGSMEPSVTQIDPNNPGPVEPEDAAQRYARLFNIAA